MPRKFFVGGNWKLNPTSLADAKSLATALSQASLTSETGMWASSYGGADATRDLC